MYYYAFLSHNLIFIALVSAAELRVISGDARIISYGSVIDNHSGDPIYVAATTPRSGAFMAPVISQPGVNTFWRSDVFLSAPTDSGGSFDLTYVDAVTGERVVKHGSVAGHQAVRLDDVIGDYFGRTGGFGSIRADLSGTIVATSRTFTSSKDGTYGQFIPLTHLGVVGGGPVTDLFFGPHEVLHVERSAAFRTNIGAINTSDGDESIRFTLYDAGGRALGSTNRTIGPLRAFQFSLDSLAASPVVNGRVEVQVLTGAGKALAWASVVDNITGDPIFVPAQ